MRLHTGAAKTQFQKSEQISVLSRTIAALWRRAPRWARRFGALLAESRFTVTVGAVVVDSRRRVLLLHHRFRAGSGWGIPGGFMRPREQPEEAIRRELREEIGLEIEITDLALIRTLQRYQQVEIIFRCFPKGIPLPQSFEVTRAEWFDLNSLPHDLGVDQRWLIRQVLAHQ
jgi:8-oxo-dGTP diphosphatase